MRQHKEKYYKKLQKLLAGGFFICGIIPILIIATTSVYNSRQVAIQDIKGNASQIIVHQRDVINKFLKHQIDLLTTLINLFPPEDFSNIDNLDQLFLAASKSGAIVDLQTIAASGRQLAYVGPYREQVTGKQYKDQPWFREVLERSVYVSDIFSGYRNLPHFVVALTDPLKSYVLRATINSSAFNSLLHSAQVGAHGDAFIVNSKGALQTPSLQHTDAITEPEKKLIRYHSGAEVVQQGDTIYATTWLDNGNWLLMFKVYIPDMLTGYYDHLQHTLLIILATASFFLAIAYYFSRLFVARIAGTDRETAVMDQQMAHIEKMANVGRLAAGVAHEINNPLQMIMAQVGWLEELLPEEEPDALKNYDEYVTTINKMKHHVERAAVITHRLLGFSRKIRAEQEPVETNALVEETLSFLQKEAEHNNINVNLHLEPDLPPTITEGHRLQQVLLNLIDNALDAVGHDGQVDITTSSTKQSINIQIVDNGPGISSEVMKQIWNPFFTTKEQGKGTGLGLSISQNIIQSLGGNIEAANRTEGGSAFTITIPLRQLTHHD